MGVEVRFEAQLARPRSESEVHLVDGTVAAFAYARLTEPDEDVGRQMPAKRLG